MAYRYAFIVSSFLVCFRRALGSPFDYPSIPQLLSRQAFSLDPTVIPAQCRSQGCDQIISTYNVCVQSTLPTCLCNTQSEGNLVICMNCLLDMFPDQEQAEQAFVSKYVIDCRVLGISLPPAIVSAASSNAATTANRPNTIASGPSPSGAPNTIVSTPVTAVGGPTTSADASHQDGGSNGGNGNIFGPPNSASSFTSVSFPSIVLACLAVMFGLMGV